MRKGSDNPLDVTHDNPDRVHAFADLGWVPHKPETWGGRFAEVNRDLVGKSWNGHEARWEGKPEFTDVPMPKGTTVKIVMVSRFGDVGITPNLNAETGYLLRVPLDHLDNIRKER